MNGSIENLRVRDEEGDEQASKWGALSMKRWYSRIGKGRSKGKEYQLSRRVIGGTSGGLEAAYLRGPKPCKAGRQSDPLKAE